MKYKLGKFKDLTGTRFGRLIVVKRAENQKNRIMWHCICDCGNETIVNGYSLTRGATKSCGCIQKEYMSKTRFQDLTGQIFGRLKVIKRVENRKNCTMWLCKCECDNETIVSTGDLKSGHTKSCGCYKIERIIETKSKYNNYDLSGEYGRGWDSKGNEFWFDLEDYDKIKNYCWLMNRLGYFITNGKSSDNDKTLWMHRVVMNIPNNADYDIDHIYHRPYDNRKSQLRVCKHSDNIKNRAIAINNTSGVTGVYWLKKYEKWCAKITVDGKEIHLGLFKDFDNAVTVRQEAENKYFGEYRYKED